MKKFNLSNMKDQKELLKKFGENDPVIRVKRNCIIRARNHKYQIGLIDKEISELRDKITQLNSADGDDRFKNELESDICSSRIRDLLKKRKHLKTDIKFLSKQITLLESTSSNGDIER